MKRNKSLEHVTYSLMAAGSAIWLLAQDVVYLIPILGIVGPILVIKQEQGREAVEEIRKNIIQELPRLFELRSPGDNLKVNAFASSVTRSQKEMYAE